MNEIKVGALTSSILTSHRIIVEGRKLWFLALLINFVDIRAKLKWRLFFQFQIHSKKSSIIYVSGKEVFFKSIEQVARLSFVIYYSGIHKLSICINSTNASRTLENFWNVPANWRQEHRSFLTYPHLHMHDPAIQTRCICQPSVRSPCRCSMSRSAAPVASLLSRRVVARRATAWRFAKPTRTTRTCECCFVDSARRPCLKTCEIFRFVLLRGVYFFARQTSYDLVWPARMTRTKVMRTPRHTVSICEQSLSESAL